MRVRKIQGSRETRNLRVAAYARVSTLEEEQEESFETQRQYYKELIDATPRWSLVDVYADKGRSGSSADLRPGFQNMMRDARSGLIDLILVKSVSRFARNVIDANDYIHELKGLSVEVRFDREGISSFDPSADMVFSILAATAQEEIKSLSEKVKWTNRRLMERGIHHVGSFHMLGMDEKGGKLTPNNEAWIIKQVFEDYAAGLSVVEIARHLNSLGAKTLRANGDFRPATVEKLLCNECYVGDRLLQKRAPKNYLTHRPDESQSYESRYITDDHEGIVSRELWETVQDMRKERREKLDNGVHLKKGCHPLYGKIFCAHCGMPYCRRITRAHNGSKEVSWECVERFKGKKGNGCMNPIIKERHILKAIRDKIGSENPDLIERIEIGEDYSIHVK